MAPRKKLPAELRLLAQQLLSDQSAEVRVEDLLEAAKFLGIHLQQFQADPRKPHDEASPHAEEPIEETFRKKYQHELLEINAARLGLKLR